MICIEQPKGTTKLSKSSQLHAAMRELYVLRYATGEDDRTTLIANLQRLGFWGYDLLREIDSADEYAARIAHDAASRHYDRMMENER